MPFEPTSHEVNIEDEQVNIEDDESVSRTMTDTSLEADGATALERVVTSTDANTLGRYWLGAGSLTLLASLVAGVLVALERLDLGGAEVFGSADEIFQFWSAYRVGLVQIGRAHV